MNNKPEPEKSEVSRDIAILIGITTGGGALSAVNMFVFNVWVGLLLLVFFGVVNSFSAYNLIRKYYYTGGSDSIDWVRKEVYGN